MEAPAAPVLVIGAGRMGTALCQWLADLDEPPQAVVSRRLASARKLQRRFGTAAWSLDDLEELDGRLAALPPERPGRFPAKRPGRFPAKHRGRFPAEHRGGLPRRRPGLVLLAVPDDALEEVSARLAAALPDWTGWAVVHTSGARSSEALRAVRRAGAAVASMYPMMTFPQGGPGRTPSPEGLIFSLEGDTSARRRARRLVERWNGIPLVLSPAAKSAYHLAATLVGPGAVVEMAAAEAVLRRAGLKGQTFAQARLGLAALLETTARNLGRGTAAAWTGPVARGDAETMAVHWHYARTPRLRRLYAALVENGLELLPCAEAPRVRRTLARAGAKPLAAVKR